MSMTVARRKKGPLRRVQSQCCHGDGRVINGEDDATELRGGCCRLVNSEGAAVVAAFFGVGDGVDVVPASCSGGGTWWWERKKIRVRVLVM